MRDPYIPKVGAQCPLSQLKNAFLESEPQERDFGLARLCSCDPLVPKKAGARSAEQDVLSEHGPRPRLRGGIALNAWLLGGMFPEVGWTLSLCGGW